MAFEERGISGPNELVSRFFNGLEEALVDRADGLHFRDEEEILQHVRRLVDQFENLDARLKTVAYVSQAFADRIAPAQKETYTPADVCSLQAKPG